MSLKSRQICRHLSDRLFCPGRKRASVCICRDTELGSEISVGFRILNIYGIWEDLGAWHWHGSHDIRKTERKKKTVCTAVALAYARPVKPKRAAFLVAQPNKRSGA